MKSSVLRAQAMQDISREEKGIREILNNINCNIGTKVNDILKIDNYAYLRDRRTAHSLVKENTTDRVAIYENKIKLMS